MRSVIGSNEWRERQAAGIAVAKSQGKYKGRKRGTLKADASRAVALREQGLKDSEIAKALGVTRRTVQRYLKRCQAHQALRDKRWFRNKLAQLRKRSPSCNAAWDDLYRSYTGSCQACGIGEHEAGGSLVPVVDEESRFIGWQCRRCSIGRVLELVAEGSVISATRK